MDRKIRTIYVIYTPNERPLLETIVHTLTTQYDVEIKMAPLGIKAGSDEWREIVEAEISKCEAAIIAITPNSVRDETVRWRFGLALKLDLMIAPLNFGDGSLYLEEMDTYPLLELKYYNWIPYLQRFHEASVATIAACFRLSKKLPTVSCFLSYSRQDSEFAAKLAEDLRRVGIITWRDAENIAAGANWDREIEKAINNCTHVIFIASLKSVVSENVLDEIGLALNKSKTVIPVLLEKCELPLRVHRAQWVDFHNDYDIGLQLLRDQLRLNS